MVLSEDQCRFGNTESSGAQIAPPSWVSLEARMSAFCISLLGAGYSAPVVLGVPNQQGWPLLFSRKCSEEGAAVGHWQALLTASRGWEKVEGNLGRMSVHC